MGFHVPVTRIAKAHADNTVKLRLCYSAAANRLGMTTLMVKILKAEGFEVKTGDAPMDPIERDLVESLQLRDPALKEP